MSIGGLLVEAMPDSQQELRKDCIADSKENW